MKFHAYLNSTGEGDYLASAQEMPDATGRGLSPQSALDQLRAELRYRIEFCPCSSVGDDFIELEVLGG